MKVTPAFGPMSGKMGGTVASRNRGGAYFRAKVVPTNPNSTRQAAVRNYFTAAVNSWITELDAAQREAWSTYASNTPYSDTLGQTITMTGQNAYIAMYVARATAGLPNILNAPTLFDTGQPVVAILGDDGGGPVPLKIALDGSSIGDTTFELMSPTDDDGDILMQIGAPVNPTVKFFKGPYQYGSKTAITSGASSVAVTAVDPTIDAPLVIGQFRPVRIRVAYDDGRISTPYEVICEIVEVSV